MPIETCKKKNSTQKNWKTSARAAKLRKVAKKLQEGINHERAAAQNANPNKAPVLKDTNPMPNTTQESVPMTPAMTAVAQAVRFDPYDRPIEFSEFEAKYGIGSPDNLGMDRVSFRESL